MHRRTALSLSLLALTAGCGTAHATAGPPAAASPAASTWVSRTAPAGVQTPAAVSPVTVPSPATTVGPARSTGSSPRPAPSTSASPHASAAAPTSSPTPSTSVADLPTATFGTWTGVKPLVVYFTADSGNVVGPLTWTRWDQRSAVGEGTWNYDDCQPSCAEGKVTHYSATITLSRPSHGQFTLVTEVQTGPHGTTQTWRLPNGGLWARSTLS